MKKTIMKRPTFISLVWRRPSDGNDEITLLDLTPEQWRKIEGIKGPVEMISVCDNYGDAIVEIYNGPLFEDLPK